MQEADFSSATAARAAKGGAVTYRPSIAERIAWTSARLSSPDAKVLLALAACGDWETGENCYPTLSTLVSRSGLSLSTITRSLRRLKDPAQPGGPWIVASKRRHRHSTTYDICVKRLEQRALKEQQTSMHIEPAELFDGHNDHQASPDYVKFDGQNDHQNKSDGQNDHQDPRSDGQNDHPISSSDLPVRTHSTRARDGRSDRIHEPEPGDLALVGATPPPRCAHPHAHAWCGRKCVPKILHFEFLDAIGGPLNEPRVEKAGRLVAFYAATIAAIPPTDPIGEEPFKFWRARFAAAFTSPPAARPATRDDAWRRTVGAVVSDEDRAASAARRAAREAREEAALEAATRVYHELRPDARAELEREAGEELKDFRPRMTADNFATSVRATVIRYLRDELRGSDQRKQG